MTAELFLRRAVLLTFAPLLPVLYAVLWLLVAFHEPSRKVTVKALENFPAAALRAWGTAHCRCCRDLTKERPQTAA